jgi:hypothetical protein
MKTPTGWALANMWYDKYQGMPPAGTPLESIFTLVFLHKKESEMLATRATIQALVSEKADPAIEAYKQYCDAMFPYIERAMNTEHDEAREALLEMAKHPLRISLSSLYKAQADAWKKKPGRRMKVPGALRIKPKIPGTS